MINQQPNLVKSAARTIDIIEYVIKKSPKPPTFSSIQENTGIPKSSLSYLLQELINKEYLQYDSDSRTYFPGLALIQLGAICINNTNISREIWTGAQKLSEELGDTTHAGTLDGRHVVYIAKCQGIKDCSAITTIGHRIPAHATAIGKVLLAALEPEEVYLRFQEVKLEQFTPNTIQSFERLLAEIEDVAQKGFAIDNQEIIPGGICVAAPILDKSHKTIAALSVTMPAIRVSDAFLPEVIAKVRESAHHVSLRLGRVC